LGEGERLRRSGQPRAAGAGGRRVKTLEFPVRGDQRKNAAQRAVNEVYNLPPGAKIPKNRQKK
jgi:hypothetical protein